METADLLLTDPDLADVRREHEAAARLLAATAHAPPPSADAGDGTARLASVVDTLLATTSGLARLERRLAERVGEAASGLALVDVEVAGRLHPRGLLP